MASKIAFGETYSDFAHPPKLVIESLLPYSKSEGGK
jgi:hypothetical protein